MGGGINENGKEKKEKYFHYWRARKWGGHLSIFIFTVARLRLKKFLFLGVGFLKIQNYYRP